MPRFEDENNIFQRVSRYKGYKLRGNYRSINVSFADFSPLPRAKYTNFFSRVYFFFVFERNETVNTNRRSRNLDLDRSKARRDYLEKEKKKEKKSDDSPREDRGENRS